MGTHGVKTPWPLVREALRALASGATQLEAAALIDVNDRTIRNLMAVHGVWVLRERTARAGTLTVDDREEIFVGIQRNEPTAKIADRLGFDRSTIYREIRVNGGRNAYRPFRAQTGSDDRARRVRPCWTETRPWLWQHVQGVLREQKWSPEQLAASLRRRHPDDPQWWVSHESIYQALFVQAKGQLRKELTACLRTERVHDDHAADARSPGR